MKEKTEAWPEEVRMAEMTKELSHGHFCREPKGYNDKIEYTPEEELERATWELNVAQQAYFKALNRVQQERDYGEAK